MKKYNIFVIITFFFFLTNGFTKVKDRLLVPVKLENDNKNISEKYLLVVVENKVLNYSDSQIAFYNHIDKSFIAAVTLPVGIYNYYFTDNISNYYNKTRSSVFEDNIYKNILVVNERFFPPFIEKNNYVADEFIIFKDYEELKLLTLNSDMDEVNLFFKVKVNLFFDEIEMKFEYPMTKIKTEGFFDYYTFKEEFFQLKPFEFCFTVRSGIYKFFVDKDGLKLGNDNLNLFVFD